MDIRGDTFISGSVQGYTIAGDTLAIFFLENPIPKLDFFVGTLISKKILKKCSIHGIGTHLRLGKIFFFDRCILKP